jgi:hypothetical protein
VAFDLFAGFVVIVFVAFDLFAGFVVIVSAY